MKAMGRVLGVVILALALSFSGAWAQGVIKIGVVTATTGKYAPLGQGNITAINLGAKLLNQQGGVLGKKIEIVFHDGEALPEKSSQLTKKVVEEDKVPAVIGCCSTVASFAISNVCNEKKVLHTYCCPQTSIWKRDGKIFKYSFPTVFGNNLDAQAIAIFLGRLNVTKVAIFHDSNQYGTEGGDLLEKALQKDGKIKVVAKEKYQTTDRDLTAALTKMQMQGPQAMVIWGTMPTPPIIARNMRQIGMNIQIIGAQGMATPDYALMGKEAAEGTVFTSPLNYGNPLPEEKMLFDNYLIEYKKPPSPFAAHGWDAFMLVVESIKRSNSTDPDKMQAALENLKGYKGAMGVFNFSPDNHDGLSLDAVSYIKVKEGKWISVQ